ncbi:zinc finger protein ZIC 2-like [Anopheles albimanus]|uniref:zinc finger protein ZIC 2-like n=1 Tax=Anopheles albimanus TaxID=7167 RepID=UPI00163FAD23|nr:zinc finger protein ZIC 2-like [Anopheles albimanus]
MSMNPCKSGDREKDQNNNFVNASAHGGAGVNRERRARRVAAAAAAAAAASATRSGASEDPQQLMRNGNSRSNGYYYNGHQRPNGDGHHGSAGSTGATGAGAPGGGVGIGGPHVTAKVMWGNVSAIKELRDKEQSDRQLGTRAAGRRQ